MRFFDLNIVEQPVGQNSPFANRFCSVLTAAALLLVGLAGYARLYIGVNITDEGFHNALPYSFALGVRPYREELNIDQNAGILLTPFYYVYYRIAGSSVGIVLFNRHLYFILLSACAWLAYKVGRSLLGCNFGRLLAAFTLTFSYFNIPSLSYCTLGAFFLFGGIFLLLDFCFETNAQRPSRRIFVANVCFTLSAFVYPTLLLSSIAGFGISLWLVARAARENQSPNVHLNRIAWLTSVAVSGFAAVVFFVYFQPSNIRSAVEFSVQAEHHLVDAAPRKTGYILGQLRDLGPYLPVFTFLLTLPILPRQLFQRMRMRYFLGILIASYILVFFIYRQPSRISYPASSTPLFLCFALLLPGVCFLLRHHHTARDLAIVVCLPSWIAGVIISYTSTNCLTAATLGLFPASVAVFLGVGLIAQAIDKDPRSNGVRLVSVLGCAIPVLTFQMFSLLEKSYLDAPFSGGTGPAFASGPYAGILTTEPMARGLRLVSMDLNSLGRARTLFINGEFPGGYLFSTLRPRTISCWLGLPKDPIARTKLTHRIFGAEQPPPDAILQIGDREPWIDAEIHRLDYTIHLERPELGYTLFTRIHDDHR